jgi:hypothetical protein
MLTLILAVSLPLWLAVEEVLRIRADQKSDAGTRIIVPIDHAMPVAATRARTPDVEPVGAMTI